MGDNTCSWRFTTNFSPSHYRKAWGVPSVNSASHRTINLRCLLWYGWKSIMGMRSQTGWRTKGEDASLLPVAVRTRRVSCRDLKGIEHTVEVTADSLHEAVAQALRVFREDTWVDEIGRGLTAVKVVVTQPEVKHRVVIRDFERWLDSGGKTPAEITLKSRLRTLLAK